MAVIANSEITNAKTPRAEYFSPSGDFRFAVTSGSVQLEMIFPDEPIPIRLNEYKDGQMCPATFAPGNCVIDHVTGVQYRFIPGAGGASAKAYSI